LISAGAGLPRKADDRMQHRPTLSIGALLRRAASIEDISDKSTTRTCRCLRSPSMWVMQLNTFQFNIIATSMSPDWFLMANRDWCGHCSTRTLMITTTRNRSGFAIIVGDCNERTKACPICSSSSMQWPTHVGYECNYNANTQTHPPGLVIFTATRLDRNRSNSLQDHRHTRRDLVQKQRQPQLSTLATSSPFAEGNADLKSLRQPTKRSFTVQHPFGVLGFRSRRRNSHRPR